ncbi:hypothetical protein IW138_004538 [Coemansia sp. RSA 986]|nr:hypothetical protein IW138_004538 [Coemansia sp. RSA 986]
MTILFRSTAAATACQKDTRAIPPDDKFGITSEDAREFALSAHLPIQQGHLPPDVLPLFDHNALMAELDRLRYCVTASCTRTGPGAGSSTIPGINDAKKRTTHDPDSAPALHTPAIQTKLPLLP